MSLTISTEPTPILINAEGVARVGGTRVSLDTVVSAFNAGSTPEEIVQRYPALLLPDVYAVVAFYLRNQKAVDSFVEHRRELASATRRDIEAQNDLTGIRERLMARRANGQR